MTADRHAPSAMPAATPGRVPLSACVIAFNEADRIGECLASLAFCDEIVVVDSGSTDGTREVARAAGARVLERAFDGFRSQKQFAIQQCAHDWILSLDADERVDARLRAAIEAERDGGFQRAAGYRFARMSEYYGRFLRHGTAYPDRVLRLFDRRRGGWHGDREIHEAVSVEGLVALLPGDLLHHPFRSFMQLLDKKQRYARMMAEHDFARGKRATLGKLVLAPAWRFFRGFVLKAGFLDGWPGLIESFVSANYVRQKTIMLWLLQNGQPLVDPPRSRRDHNAAP
ncbi:glycosyltransferase family 2 protein [Pseudoxanthomonas daejeonensis]|uniref:glycosyltransferase family 2 protein n=1 Tax=Pseudoxanthomonas daejeonensis TaxID=266062 RepID=UPI003CE4B227